MKQLLFLIGSWGALVSAEANAAAWCVLRGINVESNAGGILMLHADASSDGGAKTFTYVCSTASQSNGVSESACKSWLALAVAAQLAGKSITIYTSGADCGVGNFPTWGWVAGPGYLRVNP